MAIEIEEAVGCLHGPHCAEAASPIHGWVKGRQR
jgi:hypothetical protein